MRVVATALLVLMAIIFIAARSFEDGRPWLGFVRAFAEAAMVGGLADWFAVTALFRHPLGLPIPHTAIIPRNKDRIAANLATFLRTNFLTPGIVARRLEQFDMAGAAGRWLAQPSRDGRLRRGFGKLMAQFVEALDSDAIGGLIRQAALSRFRGVEISPLLGQMLEGAIEANRHEPLIEAGLRWAARTLDANEMMIRDLVRARTAWFLRLAAVDERVSDNIIKALRKLLHDMAEDPAHPLRLRVIEGLRTLAFDLKHLPETRGKVEAIKNELIESPVVGAYLTGLWESSKKSLLHALADPDAAFAGRLGEAMRRLGQTLEADARLRGAINLYARRAIVSLVADYGDEVVRIVSDTINGWDARTVTEKLETAVGRDLQYIRINGTLIGGLVGLGIHSMSVLL